MRIANQPRQRQEYHIDHNRSVLWILHRKNASSSLRKAIETTGGVVDTEALRFKHYHTITLLRHPWDRMTSGLYNPYGDDSRSFRQRLHDEVLTRPDLSCVDRHLQPQWYIMDGFRVDRALIYERLDEDWAELQQDFDLPNLEHANKGIDHDWRRPDGEPMDWSPLYEWYERDFELCAEWEKT